MSHHEGSFLLEVLDVFAFDHTEDLFWRTDGEYAPVTFFARVDDVFAWGTADLERVDDNDVAALRQARADAVVADAERGEDWWVELWAARKRRWRPQAAVLRAVGDDLRPLFEACGPERSESLRCGPHEELSPELRRRVDALEDPSEVRAGDHP